MRTIRLRYDCVLYDYDMIAYCTITYDTIQLRYDCDDLKNEECEMIVGFYGSRVTRQIGGGDGKQPVTKSAYSVSAIRREITHLLFAGQFPQNAEQ